MFELNGYIKLHRKLAQWGWYKNYVIKDTFIHCLIFANYTERPFEGMIIKKGQFVTSYDRLASELGFSVQQIRTAIKKLKSTGEITTKSTSKFTVITVVNWEDYQNTEEFPTSKTTYTLTNEQQSSNKQITNNQQQRKNIKNIKNKKNNIYAQKDCACEFFEILWQRYPRKKGKSSVSKKAMQEINNVGFERMSKAIDNYRADIEHNNTQEQYIMYGSTFFNGGYKDWLEVNSEPDIYSDEYMASFGVEIAGQPKPPMRRQKA